MHSKTNRPRRKRQKLVLTFVGVILSYLANVSSLSITHYYRPRGTSHMMPTAAAAAATTSPEAIPADDSNDVNIHYSYSFQRHVVKHNHQVLESFEFLDEAREAYPNAIVSPLTQECASIIAGGGLEETTAYTMECEMSVDDSLIDACIEAMPLEEPIAEMIKTTTAPLGRWAGFTPDRIRSNVQQLQSLLETKLQLGSAAVAVVNNFPQVLLYDPLLVEERLNFLLAPSLPPIDGDDNNLDWPLLAFQGYGVGWTMHQVRQALQAVPHVVLSMNLEDTFAMRPSLFYFLSALQVSYQAVDQVRVELEEAGGDLYTFAYLHSNLGVDWTQLHMMMDAFPCLSICNTEPTWEMLGTNVRSVLKEDALHYLQRRLQVGPSTIEALIKTHPRLSVYSVEGKIQPTLDALQAKLGFSSRDLRKVILRMPSLIGMSVTQSSERGLTQRLAFFCDEVGMAQQELRKAVLKQPSLLQYSVENTLRPKLDFFVDELYVPLTNMPLVIARHPVLMGLSLNETLRPVTAALMERCGLSPEELGSIVTRAPNILGLSLKRNLEPTLDYLKDRLGLSKPQLKKLIISTPRVLLYSVKSSLEPKLRMVEEAMGAENPAVEATKVMTQNPALLVLDIARLERRLESGLKNQRKNQSASRVKKVLQPQSKGLTRRKRPVLEMDSDAKEVIQEYASASVAAKQLGTSLSNMYSILRTGRLWKGKKVVYGELPKEEESAPIRSPTIQVQTNETQEWRPKRKPLVFNDLKSALKASNDMVQQFRPSTDASIRIVVFVSGRVYPPDSNTEVRGIRRAGGMVLWFPQIHQDHPELAFRLRLAAERSFGQIMPLDNGEGTCYSDGRILIGFPYLRPSRSRCELYACHEAIKVVGQLLKHESTLTLLQNETVQVDIYTNSDYAWNSLSNTTRLHTWGSVWNEKDFVYDGPGPSWRANPDLLHPLSRTYFRLVEQVDSDDVTRLVLGKHVNVTFHHAAGHVPTNLNGYAKHAAMWMNQRAKTAAKM